MLDGGVEVHATRIFGAEAFSFAVRAENRAIRDAVETLFSDLPAGREPAAEFSIIGAPNGFRLLGPEPWSANGQRDGDTILNDLVTAVNRRRLDAGADRLHLHAGMVAKDGAAVLIAGSSGMGKTTLVTALALRGWVYLTDEASSIALGDPMVRAFPKPVTLKQLGSGLFPELAAERVSIDDTGSSLWNVPLGRVGVATATAAEPTLIVTLSRAYQQIPTWEPIRPADVIVELVEQTLDLERYGDDALLALGELCAGRRCVHIEGGTPEATAELVEELATHSGEPERAVRRIEIGPGSGCVDPNVIAVGIGDEVVLRHRVTGGVISLNPAGAELWAQLSSPAFEPDALTREQSLFVRELAGLSFVQLPPESAVARGA